MAYSTPNFKLIFAAILVLFLFMLASDEATAARTNLNNDNDVMMMMMGRKHDKWMAQYGRVYKDEAEKARRFEIFKENVEFIECFNKAGTRRSYSLAVNEFVDLTNEEFKNTRNGYIPSSHFSGSTSSSSSSSFRYQNISDVPDSVDWRKKGAVTGVKDQGQCGCCWAFSAVTAVEGLNQIKTKKLVPLSVQELVDCDTAVNRGCNGGFMNEAFKYIIENEGITAESNYPYQGVDNGTCKANKSKKSSLPVAAEITGYEDVPANSESALLNAVANQPVSVAIDAGGSEFQFYKSGVFTGDCGTELNHGVTAVGYGETEDGTKYWVVKNSWGSNWGENGYIRMQRDVDAKEGLCGIAMQASYPTK